MSKFTRLLILRFKIASPPRESAAVSPWSQRGVVEANLMAWPNTLSSEMTQFNYPRRPDGGRHRPSILAESGVNHSEV